MKGGAFSKLTLRDIPLDGKTVLLRADYNVPMSKDGNVADDFRIRSSLPTVRYLLDHNCRVIIISHLGRPDGKRDMRYTLEPAAARLAELLRSPVRFVDDCVGHKVFMATKRAALGTVTILENLRFYPGEEAHDSDFARQLAKQTHADYFVQDGFGVVHRAHASTAAITAYLPSVAGLLLEREYMTITQAMHDPARPLVAVLGGAKVSDKIQVIEALIDVADQIIIGGAMANTFLADKGKFMGKSKVEDGQQAVIEKIYERARAKVGKDQVSTFLLLPSDLGVGTSLEPTATRQDVSINAIPADGIALDLGPHTIGRISAAVKKARTVIWNGTLGYAEIPAFATASAALADTLATHPDITSIIGGGDTADFAINWDARRGESFSHVSTGGGASLELISGKVLPGVAALLDAR